MISATLTKLVAQGDVEKHFREAADNVKNILESWLAIFARTDDRGQEVVDRGEIVG
jgi:hypothetical protein